MKTYIFIKDWHVVAEICFSVSVWHRFFSMYNERYLLDAVCWDNIVASESDWVYTFSKKEYNSETETYDFFPITILETS